jgi:hypothetical protein
MYKNLINKYIREVTKDMGIDQRNEVAKELKTHILDSADALAAERNVDVDDEIIREVIFKMGSAEELAALYPEEKTFKDKLLRITKFIAGFSFVFIVISAVIYQLLRIYFKNLHLDTNNIFIIITVYLVLLVIYLIYKLKISK